MPHLYTSGALLPGKDICRMGKIPEFPPVNGHSGVHQALRLGWNLAAIGAEGRAAKLKPDTGVVPLFAIFT
jgi:hypothetical protein